MRVVLASNNAKKLAELQALFAPLGVELVTQGSLGVPEAAEPHPTFVENALEKARHASRLTGLPALADDSGLSVEALGGAPGVLSARYATLFGGPRDDGANNEALLRQLQAVADRRARFVCVLAALRRADDPEPLIAMGEDVLANGDAERAVSIFRQVADMAPDHPAVAGGLIRALVAGGAGLREMFEEARRWLRP